MFISSTQDQAESFASNYNSMIDRLEVGVSHYLGHYLGVINLVLLTG